MKSIIERRNLIQNHQFGTVHPIDRITNVIEKSLEENCSAVFQDLAKAFDKV